jgi:hypothetical protein
MGAVVGATTLATGFFTMGAIIIGIVGIMTIYLMRVLRNESAILEKRGTE